MNLNLHSTFLNSCTELLFTNLSATYEKGLSVVKYLMHTRQSHDHQLPGYHTSSPSFFPN